MYDQVCKTLAENGARLVYTVNRGVAASLKKGESHYPWTRGGISLNEKIALELALAGAYSSKRTACVFSTEGLYEALDPLMSSAYTGVMGGCILVCMKEIEVDVTPLGPFAKLPVIVAEGDDDFKRAVAFGYGISEKYEIPVIVQAGVESLAEPEARGATKEGRDPSAVTDGEQRTAKPAQGDSLFEKNPGRWAATPKFRYELHRVLNGKIEKIREEFELYEGNRKTMGTKTGVITDRSKGLDYFDEDASILFVSTVHPLPLKLISGFMGELNEVVISEGPHPVMELQIDDRSKIISGKVGPFERKTKPRETMFGFDVVRDTLGPASSINMAHGIRKTEPERKILAITFEDFFFHSGMAAFVNTLYNGSAYVLVILVREREEEIRRLLGGFGFHNTFHINSYSEIEGFKDAKEMTVLFCKGIL